MCTKASHCLRAAKPTLVSTLPPSCNDVSQCAYGWSEPDQNQIQIQTPLRSRSLSLEPWEDHPVENVSDGSTSLGVVLPGSVSRHHASTAFEVRRLLLRSRRMTQCMPKPATRLAALLCTLHQRHFNRAIVSPEINMCPLVRCGSRVLRCWRFPQGCRLETQQRHQWRT
jgi:hypothetical protein